MVVTHVFTTSSKVGRSIIHDVITHTCKDIYDLYVRPSSNKVNAYYALVNDYTFNDTTILGIPCKTVRFPHNVIKYLTYNHDISCVAGSSHFFTTLATFKDVETGDLYAIKETHANTYAVKIN